MHAMALQIAKVKRCIATEIAWQRAVSENQQKGNEGI